MLKMEETNGSQVQKASHVHAGSGEETVDRISELPVHVIHGIFSKLNQKEAARTGVLSKRWYYCWTSRPNLVLCQLLRGNTYMSLEKFVNLVDQSLQPHVEENLHLEEFNLKYLVHDRTLASHIGRWIHLVVKLNVKVLRIDTLDSSSSPYYSLPDVIYAAKKLITLKLSRCKFEFDINSTTTSISFCSLKDLYLRYVHISRGQLQRVLDSCPFITNLSLSYCEGISKLHVFGGLVHLENLTVISCKLDSVIVQAPNLMQFTLIQGRNLEEVQIQAPNLLEFSFSGDKMPFSSMDPSSLESARLNFFLFKTLRIFNFGDVDSIWCTKLQHFLQKFNYSKGLMLVIFCCKTKNILIYEDPREIVFPPSPHVDIFIAPMLLVESIIDLLMSKPPKIISVLPCTNSKVLQVLPELKGCPKKRKSGKDCLFNIECSYCHRELKEVSNFMDTADEEMTSWYSWLKSTSLTDKVTTFTFNA